MYTTARVLIFRAVCNTTARVLIFRAVCILLLGCLYQGSALRLAGVLFSGLCVYYCQNNFFPQIRLISNEFYKLTY